MRPTLHSLHQALITSPTPIADTVFIINIDDVPQENTWSFARSDDKFTPDNPWLMPYFSPWASPVQYIEPPDQALAKIEKIESEIPFEKKIDAAVWRGTTLSNPDWAKRLRQTLVDVTREKDWADVQVWTEEKNNTIFIHDICKYKYIIYTEVRLIGLP